MNTKNIVELAKKGYNIEMHLMTFTEMESFIKLLKPFGYQITSISDYRYNNPNCVFVK